MPFVRVAAPSEGERSDTPRRLSDDASIDDDAKVEGKETDVSVDDGHALGMDLRPTVNQRLRTRKRANC